MYQEYLDPVPNLAAIPRQFFLRRALKAHRYFNGREGVKNSYRNWAKWGKPDIIIVRVDNWEMSFKESLLPFVYEHFISMDYWEMAILSSAEDGPHRNYFDYNKLPQIKNIKI